MSKYNDRKSSAERGYGHKWQRARADFLTKNPLCADHQRLGRIVPATIVDHIVPHKGDLKLFWDRKNWQPLCKQCHDTHKQRQESGSAAVGCDTNGVPLSVNHHWSAGGG
ncbi:MAG: HNH endonuclease [Nitrosomonas sp.]|nr:HNH endonuclease [Nitrosomonas sp.]